MISIPTFAIIMVMSLMGPKSSQSQLMFLLEETPFHKQKKVQTVIDVWKLIWSASVIGCLFSAIEPNSIEI